MAKTKLLRQLLPLSSDFRTGVTANVKSFGHAWWAEAQYRALKRIAPGEPTHMSGEAYKGCSKLEVLLGKALLDRLRGKVVLDFGCGSGECAVDLAMRGVAKVIGVDIRPAALAEARELARDSDCAVRCEFTTLAGEPVDAVVSIDAFEHFKDPAAMLSEMDRLLKPGGMVAVSFGPTWYHPLGGHLFSVLPWAHLIFSEAALIRWRTDLRSDGATRFSEVEGGLNQMTIRRFEALVAASPFRAELLELVPIRKLRWLHNRITREFTTAVVRCLLVPRVSRFGGQTWSSTH
jgi:SAM-dependent methyltransferase